MSKVYFGPVFIRLCDRPRFDLFFCFDNSGVRVAHGGSVAFYLLSRPTPFAETFRLLSWRRDEAG